MYSACGEVPYLNTSDKVKELHAWVLAPNGYVKFYGENSIADHQADAVVSGEELYSEERVRSVCANRSEIGAIFAYEAELETGLPFPQAEYRFQANFPALQSRYTVTLPYGWTALSTILNHEPVQPTFTGSTYMWELRDLPCRETETAGPTLTSLAPRLGVSFFPPAESRQSLGRSIKAWTDVSEWVTELIKGQDGIDDAMLVKSRDLTSATSSELENIRAIASYVQNIRYVAIAMNLARGGGMRPHPAPVVFQKQYGDCKDKANSMRALLKTVGIQSYLVALYSGDRTYVREEWPSPQQFNHMIIAIHIKDQTDASTVLKHPTLGRLLVFDPTDEYTPVEDLPVYEQGSLGLVIAAQNGSLVRLPVTMPEANLNELSLEGSISEAGTLKAALKDTAHGQLAVRLRANFNLQHARSNQQIVEALMNRTSKTVKVENFELQDAFSEQAFYLRMEFGSANFGQVMQNRLLVFRPETFMRPQIALKDEKRRAPVVLDAEMYREQVRIKLPANFRLDEVPENAKVETSYGKFACASLPLIAMPSVVYVERTYLEYHSTLSASPRVEKATFTSGTAAPLALLTSIKKFRK